MSISLSGVGVSRGVAIGKVHLLQRGQLEIPEYVVPPKFVEEEVARLESAIRTARAQLKAIRKHIPAGTPADISSFIDAHLLMLEDGMLSDEPIKLIRSQQCNAEWALKQQRDSVVAIFDEMEDPYLRTRRDDVDHVINRVQLLLLDESSHSTDLDSRLKGCILVADDLTPADTVLMQHYGVAGFVTEFGGPTSHTSILARSLGVPAIVGLRNARRYLADNEEVIIDGRAGHLVAGADEAILRHYRRRQREEKQRIRELKQLKDKPAITLDGKTIRLHANIELPEDIPAVKKAAADGVGLYRTEFLYMNRADTPGEEEQYRAYRHVVKSLKGAPITIRTFDLGADKQVDGITDRKPLGSNPALGLRAVRLCLRDTALFMPQLRAILRASAHGPVRIMIPMLSNLTELHQVKQLIDEARLELDRQGLAYADNVPIGGMIEIPAAAIAANHFARHLDFLSIGTNDLIQYTLAIDRIDDEVNYLYDPVHPSVLHLIHITIRAADKAGIPVSMCGEMAGDPRLTRLLLGLGLREFSMHPSVLLEIKRIINNSDTRLLLKPARRTVNSARKSDVEKIIAKMNLDALD
ncbi:phosphoenolpyruvate--protein phosphotransferase [Sulfuriflexus sp.]|uniref:phosphoenolpyruvate--protein phosphotransferase n=1 Tax=Sulfuriflexus sp. TaxID=2015443 RepID=UPI0028CC31B1|nr:phosphoenolpyruvate--protein phosphotransferase [Sulfuriflexus sp.]MDT8403479.1 phosphoenolpyruvate--protein phosphotransferase [Sulfuriflexus sp.]